WSVASRPSVSGTWAWRLQTWTIRPRVAASASRMAGTHSTGASEVNSDPGARITWSAISMALVTPGWAVASSGPMWTRRTRSVEIAALEAVLERLLPDRVGGRQRHEALAEVARGGNVVGLAQPARGSTVVGHADDRRQRTGVAPDPAQRGGEAVAAAEGHHRRA